jgi:hypothetical protein
MKVLFRFLSLPVYPLLVSILPIAEFYGFNFKTLYASDLLRAALTHTIITVALLGAGRLVLGSVSRGGLPAASAAYLIFLGGDVGGIWAAGLLVMTVLLVWALRRWPVEPRALSLALNVALLAVITPAVYKVVRGSQVIAPTPREGYGDPVALSATAARLHPLPDIYYVVVDGLGRSDVLESLYGIPRESSTRTWEDMGFQIAERSLANYPQTAMTVATTLNMVHMEELLVMPHPRSADRRPLGELIAESKVVNSLRPLGYQVVSFPSGYNLARLRNADVSKEPWMRLDFVQLHLVEKSVLPFADHLFGRGPAGTSYTAHRHRLRYILEELAQVRSGLRDDAPAFVFAHLLAPHPPFVFGPNGEALRSFQPFAFKDGNHWHDFHSGDGLSYVDLYRDQTLYVIDQLAKTMARIIQSASRPVVIVVQGDHGPGLQLDWETPDTNRMLERFAIFNAWYVPSHVRVALWPEISPVNTFPVLFNALFDAQLELRPDRASFSSWAQPYELYRLDAIQ